MGEADRVRQGVEEDGDGKVPRVAAEGKASRGKEPGLRRTETPPRSAVGRTIVRGGVVGRMIRWFLDYDMIRLLDWVPSRNKRSDLR